MHWRQSAFAESTTSLDVARVSGSSPPWGRPGPPVGPTVGADGGADGGAAPSGRHRINRRSPRFVSLPAQPEADAPMAKHGKQPRRPSPKNRNAIWPSDDVGSLLHSK